MNREPSVEEVDPRIRRTRGLLQDALGNLLQKKSFDEISVQDIAEEATVNRATFYAHYDDKFRLLESMVSRRFHELLAERQVQFDTTCTSMLQTFVLAVCDYVVALLGPAGDRRVEPHMESAVIGVLQFTFLTGLRARPRKDGAPADLVAAAAAWAMYGAAKEWALMDPRPAGEEIAGTIVALVAPVLRLCAPSL
ncbi:MAG TPA: TetR/AcrR family transcriptional regulator [Acidobacteriaceae bacterium]|jgi:AcrR family transcriptional regulator|nr:TetR/AcrR family transcriptional regulator [Acidobacteriaceae bacterium]